jgi:transcription elongation factor GreA
MTPEANTEPTRYDEAEPITAEGLQALEEEIAELEGPGRAAIAKRISAARELGDLKENAEYHIAKEDQAHLETRIQARRQRLRNAVLVEAGSGDADAFAFGRTAEVEDVESGEAHTWTLVGASEANMAEGKLSAVSPVGKALLNARVGATVKVASPRGERRLKVKRLV